MTAKIKPWPLLVALIGQNHWDVLSVQPLLGSHPIAAEAMGGP